MIKIADRYILVKFLVPLFLCLVFIIFMMHITELFDRLNFFIQNKVNPFDVILYFFYRSPLLVVQWIPIAALFATVFSLAQMSRFNETISIISTGVSFYRIIRPIFLASTILFVFAVIFNDVVVPWALKKASSMDDSFIRLRRSEVHYKILKNSYNGTLFYINRFDYADGVMHDVSMILDPHEEKSQRIDAAKAVWDPDKKLWNFHDGLMHTIVSNKLKRTVKFTNVPLKIRERPKDFKKTDQPVENMKIAEALRHIRNLRISGFSTGQEWVEFHWKFSFPFSIIIMVLIGSPLSAYSKKNVLISSFLFSFLFTFLYYILLTMGMILGKNQNIPPLIGAWLGNIGFMVITYFLMRKMKT